MKIAHIFHAYLTATENWCYRLIKNLPDSELFIVSERLINEELFPLPHAKFLLAPFAKRKSRDPWLLRKSISLFKIILRKSWHLRLVSTLREASIIHAHFSFVGWDYLWLIDKTGIPLVISFYGFDYECLPTSTPIWRERYHVLFQRAALLITEGRAGRDKLIAMGCPEHKVKIVHLGVDVATIQNFRRHKKQRELRLVQIATFVGKKGYDVTIEAFIKASSKCPGITLTLVGSNPFGIRDALQQVIRQHGLDSSVEFIDGIDFANLHEFLQQFHVFIHPSKYGNNRDSEGGAPIVLLDAQATGMPVLSTLHCDIPDEVVTGVTGILVKENDSDQLAKAIETFYDMNEELYQDFCVRARKHVEQNYDSTKGANELKAAYDTLVE